MQSPMRTLRAKRTDWDCVVVGGGPAGLTAAVYLARFRRRVLVIDAGRSRARYIPRSHNCPGFAQGVSGNALLSALRRQARRYGAVLERGSVETLLRARAGFSLEGDSAQWQASRVLIATGIVDLVPKIPGLRAAIARGVVRLCPICDGFEASGRRIAVYGPPQYASRHAEFLRTYSRHVAVVCSEPGEIAPATARSVRELGIEVIPVPQRIALDAHGVRIRGSSSERRFDVFYPSMGFEPKCRLAASLGAEVDADGEIRVDCHLETSVRHLYAAGDAVSGLHQIAVSTGQAAIAATAIHNSLAGRRP